MSDIPWTLIPIVGTIGWVLVAGAFVLTSRGRKTDADRLEAALDANTAAHRQVAEQIQALDRRLAAVEKTLTDIG